MHRLSVLFFVLFLAMMICSCGQGSKPSVSSPKADDGAASVPSHRPTIKLMSIFGGELSKYYQVGLCTLTQLSRVDLEDMNIEAKDDYRYYIVSISLERNDTPFDFPIEGIECIYDVWLVPTQFPEGKFNVHAQILDSNNTKVASLDFSDCAELKDLLRKCPHEGDYMVITDLLEIERVFDRESNKVDLRGYIKPVASH